MDQYNGPSPSLAFSTKLNGFPTRRNTNICINDLILKRGSFGICVTGYDTGLPEDDIKTALSKHFRPCGEVMDIFITRNHGSSAADSKALIHIRGEDAGDKAMELSGSDMGGCKLVAEVDSVPDEYYCYLPRKQGRPS